MQESKPQSSHIIKHLVTSATCRFCRKQSVGMKIDNDAHYALVSSYG